jgi:hypothetical protein
MARRQAHEFGRRCQVPIGADRADMAKIGSESRQLTLDIRASMIEVLKGPNGESVSLMPISALATACRVPDYAESLSNTSAGGARTVFSFGIIRVLPGRPTGCHPAGNVLA